MQAELGKTIIKALSDNCSNFFWERAEIKVAGWLYGNPAELISIFHFSQIAFPLPPTRLIDESISKLMQVFSFRPHTVISPISLPLSSFIGVHVCDLFYSYLNWARHLLSKILRSFSGCRLNKFLDQFYKTKEAVCRVELVKE